MIRTNLVSKVCHIQEFPIQPTAYPV